jgi:PQQ-like domain
MPGDPDPAPRDARSGRRSVYTRRRVAARPAAVWVIPPRSGRSAKGQSDPCRRPGEGPNLWLRDGNPAPKAIGGDPDERTQRQHRCQGPARAAAGVGVTGSFAAAPVVVDSVVYIQDLDCNVYALPLATGKLLWEHQVNMPEVSGPGPNGVAVGGGRVYGTTPHTVFALRAATGK